MSLLIYKRFSMSFVALNHIGQFLTTFGKHLVIFKLGRTIFLNESGNLFLASGCRQTTQILRSSASFRLSSAEAAKFWTASQSKAFMRRLENEERIRETNQESSKFFHISLLLVSNACLWILSLFENFKALNFLQPLITWQASSSPLK